MVFTEIKNPSNGITQSDGNKNINPMLNLL